MPTNPELKKVRNIKAEALLCPICCVEYEEMEIDLDVDGVILHDVKVLHCPICQEERFAPHQREVIEAQLHGYSSKP